jgi:hypothetical protein
MPDAATVSVRYLVDDVEASIAFYFIELFEPAQR